MRCVPGGRELATSKDEHCEGDNGKDDEDCVKHADLIPSVVVLQTKNFPSLFRCNPLPSPSVQLIIRA